MTYICVPILVERPEDAFDAIQAGERALGAANAARDAGAKLVEWRVDLIAEEAGLIERLIRESPLPCIVTCRPASEGGEYEGSEMERIALLEHIGLHGRPRYVDVELAAYARSANVRQKVRLAVRHPDQLREMVTGLILSSHDFSGRPADLTKRVLAMVEDEACEVVKVAWMARSVRDNLEAFDILSARHKPTIAICMGPFGLMSRVLAPKFGGLVTFASMARGGETAPGQVSIEELRGLYRFDAIDARTKVYGVVGWPVEHSQSPRLHNALFAEAGFNGVYVPLPVPAEYEHFKATVLALLDHPRLDFAGCSVTLPHKAHLLRLAEEISRGGERRVYVDPAAREAGAANTLAVGETGRLHVTNTDVPACVESVLSALHMSAEDVEALRKLRVAVIGAGGMARAAIAGFSRIGCTVVVYNRAKERAEALAAEFSAMAAAEGWKRRVVAAPIERLCKSCCHVFINATPVGMAGGSDPEGSPIPLGAGEGGGAPDWGPSTLVFDTVYTPRETPLLKAAAAAGCATLDGLDMFIRQACMQSALWTDRMPSRAVAERALEGA